MDGQTDKIAISISPVTAVLTRDKSDSSQPLKIFRQELPVKATTKHSQHNRQIYAKLENSSLRQMCVSQQRYQNVMSVIRQICLVSSEQSNRHWVWYCLNSIKRTSPKLHRNFPETKVHDIRLVYDLSRGSFGESNELDMLSSLACLGEVCDKSTTSLGEVRVMEFDNEHDERTLAVRGGADQS